jgi:hypothetical protein
MAAIRYRIRTSSFAFWSLSFTGKSKGLGRKLVSCCCCKLGHLHVPPGCPKSRVRGTGTAMGGSAGSFYLFFRIALRLAAKSVPLDARDARPPPFDLGTLFTSDSMAYSPGSRPRSPPGNEGTGLMYLVPSFGPGFAPVPIESPGTRATSRSMALQGGCDPADICDCIVPASQMTRFYRFLADN